VRRVYDCSEQAAIPHVLQETVVDSARFHGNRRPALERQDHFGTERRRHEIWRTVSFSMSNAIHIKKSDLVYHIHDGSTALRFELSGDVSGAGVRDLQLAWRTASSTIGGRCVVVDVSAVTGMDHAGRELLKAWQVEGARTVATSSAAKARIESMLDRPVTLFGTNPKRYAWLPFRVARGWAAALLALLSPGRCSDGSKAISR